MIYLNVSDLANHIIRPHASVLLDHADVLAFIPNEHNLIYGLFQQLRHFFYFRAIC